MVFPAAEGYFNIPYAEDIAFCEISEYTRYDNKTGKAFNVGEIKGQVRYHSSY